MALSNFGLNPYVNLRTGTLHNSVGAETPQLLRELEGDLTKIRLIELKSRPVEGHFDFQHLQEINRRIYQDVYPWAGQARQNFDAVKEEYIAGPRHHFTPSAQIEKQASRIFGQLAEQDQLKRLSREEFLVGAARLHGELNQLHAFPEGNGRTQRAFIEQVAVQAQHPVDLSIGTQERIIQASIAQTKGDHGPMERFMAEAADPSRVQALRTAIEHLEKHWGRERVAGTYIAATIPGQSYSGVLVDRSGNDFLFREDNRTLLIGHRLDIPSEAMSRDYLKFTATSGDGRQVELAPVEAAAQVEQSQEQHLEPLRKALSAEDAKQFSWLAQTGSIESYQHKETLKYIHIHKSSGQFYDQQLNLITRQAALAAAMPTNREHSRDEGHGHSR